MKFNEAIKDVRYKSLLNQIDFAREMDVSFSTINRWESGKTMPKPCKLKLIKEFCDERDIGGVIMELVGLKVKHSVFGAGVITEFDDKYVTVKFSAKTTKFVYPDAFEKFIGAEDPDIQNVIRAEIAKAKDIAEQKRQVEEAARKAAEEQRQAAVAFDASKAKKAKSIDEMFAPDYHAEKLARQPILTYQQVEDQFGIRIAGFGRGINPTDSTVVLVSSIGKSSGKFVYHDKWTPDGDYLYSGEGRIGNQSMTKGNLAIKNAALNGKCIHLFVKFSPQEYYYQGMFALVDYKYEDEKDEDGNTRKEYKFRLRKVTSVKKA